MKTNGPLARMVAFIGVGCVALSILLHKSELRLVMSQDYESTTIIRSNISLEERASVAIEPYMEKVTASPTKDLPPETVVVQSRIFDPWPHGVPLPCFAPNMTLGDGEYNDRGVIKLPSKTTTVTHGLLYHKITKTASSTCSGVALRLAKNEARRQGQSFDFCNSRYTHGPPTKFAARNPAQSFLWGMIRDPAKRAISSFFHFFVSRRNVQPTDHRVIQKLRKADKRGYVSQMSLEGETKPNSTTMEKVTLANQIMTDYNFIGLTERLDESLVLLTMLLGVPVTDALYLSAKKHGSYDEFCNYIKPSFVTQAVQSYLDGPQWKHKMAVEYALYQAVNQSLDRTIDSLGRDKFQHRLALTPRTRG